MFWTIVTFVLIIGTLMLAFWPQDQTVVTVKYDCRALVNAPVAVQEECKKRMTK